MNRICTFVGGKDRFWIQVTTPLNCDMKKKILIAFFSQSGETYVNGKIISLPVGNTETVARKIAALTGGDLFHIEKEGGYPPTYRGTVEVAKEEWHTDARPVFKGGVEGMEQYDTVVLGYPNWCNTMPKPVCTFLEAYDFSGKTVIPYCTHEGSGLGSSVDDLKRLCPSSVVLEGTAIHGAEAAGADAEAERIAALALQ